MSACVFWINTLVERQRNCFRAVYKLRVKIHRKWLDNFCRNTYKVASGYITKPSSWPTVKPNDGTGLQGWSIALDQGRNAVTGMAYMNDLSTANVLRQVEEKLLRYLGSKWTEGVGRIRSRSKEAKRQQMNNILHRQRSSLSQGSIFSESLLRNLNPCPFFILMCPEGFRVI